MEDISGFGQHTIGNKQRPKLAHLFEEKSSEPMLAVKFVIFYKRENDVAEAEHLVESLTLVIALKKFPIFGDDPAALGFQSFRGALQRLAASKLFDVTRQGRERHGEIIVPAKVMVIKTIAGRHVEPWLSRPVEFRQPALARFAPPAHLSKHLLGVTIGGEKIVNAVFDGELRQSFELIVWPEHQHLDAGHHAGYRLISGLWKSLFAEIEKHHVRPVAEHQHLEMVVPHFREQLGDTVKILADVVILAEAFGLGHHFGF